MKIEDFPYLREISIDYKHHIGGYMGGGSWAITTNRDSNGDRYYYKCPTHYGPQDLSMMFV